MFEIRELRHLLSIDEYRHFGRAAKAVGLSQPALTKSLQRIEQVLGVKVFERSRAGVVPTTIGLEVLARARRLVDDVAELKRTIDALSYSKSNSVTIGVGPAMSESYVARAIASLVQEYPQSQVLVRVDHWLQLSEWLLAGELDFYVADVGKARLDNRFHYMELSPQLIVWFCRQGHPLASKRKKVSRKELLQYAIATPKLPLWAVEWFAAAFGDQGVSALPSLFPVIECESYAMLKKIVLSSDSISAALQASLEQEITDGSLCVLEVEAPVLTTQAGMVRLAERSLSKLASKLMDKIEELSCKH